MIKRTKKEIVNATEIAISIMTNKFMEAWYLHKSKGYDKKLLDENLNDFVEWYLNENTDFVNYISGYNKDFSYFFFRALGGFMMFDIDEIPIGWCDGVEEKLLGTCFENSKAPTFNRVSNISNEFFKENIENLEHLHKLLLGMLSNPQQSSKGYKRKSDEVSKRIKNAKKKNALIDQYHIWIKEALLDFRPKVLESLKMVFKDYDTFFKEVVEFYGLLGILTKEEFSKHLQRPIEINKEN